MRLSPPRAGTTASPRVDMMSLLPFVEMNAIQRPSGEYRGRVFIPGRSTMERDGSAPRETAKMRFRYCAVKPLFGAAEYAISRPSGDHEKPST